MRFICLLILLELLDLTESWSAHAGHGSSTATQMNLHWLSRYKNAVCNDGTPGGYYFASSPHSSGNGIFLITLPGGGQCYSLESCKKRERTIGCDHMSSSCFSETAYKTGLMDSSPDISSFWNANKAMLGALLPLIALRLSHSSKGYCSSDGYAGNAPASERTWGYHFRCLFFIYRLIHHMFTALVFTEGNDWSLRWSQIWWRIMD